MFQWLIVALFQFVIFGSVKNDVCKKLLLDKEMNDGRNRQ